MITYKIHFIRHATTERNLKGQYVGRFDSPLCDEGREKLLLLKEECGYPAVQKLYVSPLSRCRETAELLYPDNLQEVVDDLIEYDFGEFDGKTIAELKNDPIFNEWLNSAMKTPPPGGESAPEMEQRVCRALDYIFRDVMEKKLTSVGVVTHGGVIMTLMAKYGLPRREAAYEWMVANGAGFTVQMTPQMWMRDGGFEVYEQLPYRFEAFARLGADVYREQLRQWDENGGSFPDDESAWEDIAVEQ